ncbi:unnamed protein product [Aphanomyces euteiches]|uniref:N-acetyltransferase domain-containing protein n=1 Tax=Aphanomyces euteiches TaxID=100861 RepID=A0A6G0XJR7_9STRA|nr:hypothetical protein Ae201684_004164 [Aphanomyces euteiches]KAH9094392.1 hypothetical protein Ae201684P_017000 [Aphanomyces euteiches]KAH9108946.1 hypothetical protein AeMF1_015905 [Aphanomyces euteiches]KAH9190576.1 hypothetical protein AeNC1_007446 [Aphanomyces euteiches]
MDASGRKALSVRFGAITAQNVGVLRVLNQKIFPVRYNDGFYSDILSMPRELTKFGIVEDIIVSAICCRVETMPGGVERVYIMTLGVLEPYRRYKLGGALLQSVLDYCEKSHMDHIYLHVQTSNAEAIKFYATYGFEITQTIHNYYRNITPPDCYILARSFGTQ